MAKITQISAQKNKKRVNLYVDGAFFCGLGVETLTKNGLKVGSVVDEDWLKDLVVESDARKATDYAFDLVGRKMYSKAEIAKKLKQKGYEAPVIDVVIKKLDSYGLIDDLAYAKILVNSAKTDGERKIEAKLFSRGISKSDIKIALNDLNDETELAKMEQFSAKYFKNKLKTAENLQKFYRNLISKGFTYEQAGSFVSNLKMEDD